MKLNIPKAYLVVSISISFLVISPVSAANPNHIEQLLDTKQCYQCDLSGADLSGVVLNGVNLFEANLSGANLSGASLTGVALFCHFGL